MSETAFSQGIGEWVGDAEVYGADGRYAGIGRDTRSVRADDRAGRVTVEVSFDGPFSLSGTYTIAEQGPHRTYEGPLNVGFAETLSEGLVAAHNYWPDLGLSQRFFLMMLPDGTRQLSLALLSRGERLRWTVVGENRRRPAPAPNAGEQPRPDGRDRPAPDPAALRNDPAAGRGELLLLRSGTWSGRLHCLDAGLQQCGTVECSETVTAREGDTDAGDAAARRFDVELAGLGCAADASFTMASDGWSVWTPTGDIVGSAALSGGRALSGQFHCRDDGLRMWRREAAALDGTAKAVLHTWYRGEQRVGTVYGTLAFEPA
ncbi:hypothetical protein [Candidatus Poriferisodalis sp.]|uniref:hypothetical protein n=1 Tax=Candidatus Poriferisodalis sp. TaxID=3101277 RepID=UPI003B01E115